MSRLRFREDASSGLCLSSYVDLLDPHFLEIIQDSAVPINMERMPWKRKPADLMNWALRAFFDFGNMV